MIPYGVGDRSPAPVLVLLLLLGIGLFIALNAAGLFPDLTSNTPTGGIGEEGGRHDARAVSVLATATPDIMATQAVIDNRNATRVAEITQAAGAFRVEQTQAAATRQAEVNVVQLEATKQALSQAAADTEATRAAIDAQQKEQNARIEQQKKLEEQNLVMWQSVLILSAGGACVIFLLAVGVAIRYNQEARRKLIEADTARLEKERDLLQQQNQILENKQKMLQIQKDLAATRRMYPDNGREHISGEKRNTEQDEGYYDLPYAE